MSFDKDDDRHFQDPPRDSNPFSAPQEISFSDVPQGECPPTNLPLSIFTTLCCCLPFGIVGIIYAAQVKTLYAHGDYLGAKRSSDNARFWSLLGIAIGAIGWLINIVANVAVVFMDIEAGPGGLEP
jgi:hypothetical protein